MSGETREVISAKVSLKSAKGWRDFCAEHGISMSAALEAAGLRLAKSPTGSLEDARRSLVEDARLIDIQRRSRR